MVCRRAQLVNWWSFFCEGEGFPIQLHTFKNCPPCALTLSFKDQNRAQLTNFSVLSVWLFLIIKKNFIRLWKCMPSRCVRVLYCLLLILPNYLNENKFFSFNCVLAVWRELRSLNIVIFFWNSTAAHMCMRKKI